MRFDVRLGGSGFLRYPNSCLDDREPVLTTPAGVGGAAVGVKGHILDRMARFSLKTCSLEFKVHAMARH